MQRIDLIGKTFQNMTPLEYLGRGLYLCQCACGWRGAKKSQELRGSFSPLYCPKCNDLTGKRFGKLLAIHRDPNRRSYWICRCDCGREKSVYRSSLLNKATKSCGCFVRKPDQQVATNAIYLRYRYDAVKRRGLVWNISRGDFIKLTSLPCHYCGALPREKAQCFDASKRVKRYLCNGVDRVNNAVGYETENVVPCCEDCNIAKLDRTAAAFEAWVLKAAAHIKERTV